MAAPNRLNFVMYRGDQFDQEIQFVQNDGVSPLDLTGYTEFKADIRQTEATPVVDSFIISPNADPTSGRAVLVLPGARTALLSLGRYRYDIESLPGGAAAGDLQTLCVGDIQMLGQITV